MGTREQIPRRNLGGRPPSITSGWFVRRSDPKRSIILRDKRNNQWGISQVQIANSMFGFDDEGVSKLPRPAEYDDTGKETIRGDRVLIAFVDGSRKRPYVTSVVRSLTTDPFLPAGFRSPDGADWNRWAARLQPRNAAGTPVGSIDVEAGADGKVQLAITLGPPGGGGPRMGIVLDATGNGSIQIAGLDGTELEWAGGYITSRGAAPHPDAPVAIGGLTGAGFFFDLATALAGLGDATGMAAKLNAELAAPGTNPGYLSTVLRSS